jgi:hypothetical protein
VNSEELESQLSAMFDGELPPSECELLSRRIDREEALRARWSRYALIGAAMRSEPVATARSGFAKRVSDALAGGELRSAQVGRSRGLLWNAALAASLVAVVAGLSISMLRSSTLGGGVATLASAGTMVPRVITPSMVPAVPVVRSSVALPTESTHEPLSYVTPSGPATGEMLVKTQLADYIVAHSEYSTALMRRSLLSELVSIEDSANGAANAGAPLGTVAGHADATPATAHSAR